MKQIILILATLFSLASCIKGYNHEKIVTNNTENEITVISGCCDQEHSYQIAPRESEIVFQCAYQQINKPSVQDLAWDFKVLEVDGTTTSISNSNDWIADDNSRKLSYKYNFE